MAMRNHLGLLLLISFQASAQVNTEWVATYNGPANSADYSYALALDDSGNIYVAGESPQVANPDLIVIKYNSAGDTVWVRTYNGPGNSRDVARAVRVDGAGNVYVTGESIGSGTGFDAVTISYNAAGAERWVQRYNGPANGVDGASSLALDALGNVFITGYSDGDPNVVFRSDDYITIKYNSTGALQWARRYSVGGDGNAHDVANAIAVDTSGNCYVTGQSSGPGTGYDYLTIKYTASGDSLWSRRYHGTGNFHDFANAIAVDPSGNVFVTGSSRDSLSEDFVTIKYGPTGSTQWIHRYAGPGGPDYAYRIALDDFGNAYVTGESRGTNPVLDIDFLTIKYNSQGDTVWTARYNGPRDSIDIPVSLALDDLGNIYVTGYSVGIGSGYDYATVKYNANGIQQWVQRYTAPGSTSDIAVAVAVDSDSNVVITGRGTVATEFLNIITIKYSQIPTSISAEPNSLPAEFALHQNYPNPFNPTTTIQYSVPYFGHVTLRVYDMLGEEVASLVDQKVNAGTYSTEWKAGKVPSGVYFYRLQAGVFSQTKKLILLR